MDIKTYLEYKQHLAKEKENEEKIHLIGGARNVENAENVKL